MDFELTFYGVHLGFNATEYVVAYICSTGGLVLALKFILHRAQR